VDFCAPDETVALLEADAARTASAPVITELAWHLRQRDTIRSRSLVDVRWAHAYPHSRTDWKKTRAVVQTALVPPYVGRSERATSGSTRNASAAARNATAT